MNIHIIKFLIALVPIRALRRKLRKKIFGDNFWALKSNFCKLKLQQANLLGNANKVKTLFFGSSHMQYAFNPEYYCDSAYNLAVNSQDFYNGYELYKYYFPKLRNLDKIIIGISVFSKGFELSKTSNNFICDILSFLYEIEYNDYKPSQKIIEKIKCTNKKQIIYNGFLYPTPISIDAENVETRTKTHLRENKREPNQLNILLDWINEINNNKQMLTLVIMPATSKYKAQLPKANELFSSFYYLDPKLRIVDFYQSDIFSDDDFYDYDHLNEVGSKKFSVLLKDVLND